MHDAKLGEKDGRRVQILSVGRKLFYEIHPNLEGKWKECSTSKLVVFMSASILTLLDLYSLG
jgi:hypothetical protein